MILTGDTGLKLRARRHDVPCAAINEAWLLAEETDERDKEITSLKAELTELRATEPTLKVSMRGADGQRLSKLTATLPTYAPLTTDEIDSLLKAVQQRCPKAQDFRTTPPSEPNTLAIELWKSVRTWQAPTPAEIEAYSKAYDEWFAEARHRFERLGTLLTVRSRVLPIEIELCNTGIRPAEEVLFELSAPDGVKFCISLDSTPPKIIKQLERLKSDVHLDAPPSAPQGEYVTDQFSRFLDHRAFDVAIPEALHARMPQVVIPPLRRDRHVFFRDDDADDPSTKCVFSRAEFRHAADPQVFRVWLVLPVDETPARSHLRCRVSARNLTKAIDIRIPLEFTYESRTSIEVARQWRVRRAKS